MDVSHSTDLKQSVLSMTSVCVCVCVVTEKVIVSQIEEVAGNLVRLVSC